MAIDKELLDQLLEGRDPQELFSKDGLIDELKKAVSERLLNTELDEHLRKEGSKGCLTRKGMLHMMFKLGQCAEKSWRKLRGFEDLPKVITGVRFKDGIEETQTSQIAA